MNRPTKTINPLADGGFWNPADFRPFGNAVRFSIDRQEAIATCVAHLLRSSSPVAILFAVSCVIVLAFNFMGSTWTVPHVGEEIDKGSFPSGANENSASAVVPVVVMVAVCATGDHSLPDSVFWGTTLSVRSSCVAEQFTFKATATTRVATVQGGPKYNPFLTALATAKPPCESMTVWIGECDHFVPNELVVDLNLGEHSSTLGSSHDMNLLFRFVSGESQAGVPPPLGSRHFTNSESFNQSLET